MIYGKLQKAGRWVKDHAAPLAVVAIAVLA